MLKRWTKKVILLALHAQKSSHMPKCVPTDRNQVCSLKFWHLFSVMLHDFNSVCEYVFLHSCSLNTPRQKLHCLRKFCPTFCPIAIMVDFENFSSVRGLQPLALYLLRLCLPQVSLYEIVVYEHMSRVLRQCKNIDFFVHFGHSKHG